VDIETIVVGGGVVGLASAKALAACGREVLLIERRTRLGQETSARSSEVVHAGLYYPPGSLKARLCVEGRQRLGDFCRAAGVPYAPLGKLIVAASDAEIADLEGLAGRARANGVTDVRLLSAAEARRLEPALACTAALHAPASAVVDSTGYLLALEARFIDLGGLVAVGTTVVGLQALSGGGFGVRTLANGAETALTCRDLVLAGGLEATHLGRMLASHLSTPVPETHYAKGHYFALAGPPPFSRLVYPLPGDGGLGIHFTLSTAGEARFGPDVAWCGTPSLTFDDPDGRRRAAFVAAIRRYWPGVREEGLAPAFVGLRPKIGAPGGPAADFAIHGPRHHGCAGLVALYGIESPGLTASLAIGHHVADLLSAPAG